MATTIPTQLYVTIQYDDQTTSKTSQLGFAGPYTQDAGFAKRKVTQDTWAYGRATQVTIHENQDITLVTSDVVQQQTYASGSNSKYWDAGMLFISNCYPRIIDNVPLEGFEIGKTVRRSGWSGGGNVKWRITDPRGFDLEISSENFASLVDCADLTKGLIQGKCAWGRDGARNILLPVSSTPFLEATRQTIKENTKIPLSQVQCGDTVELINSQLPRLEREFIFYGKMHILSHVRTIKDALVGGKLNNIHAYSMHAERMIYLVKSVATGEYYSLLNPRVSSIVNKLPIALNAVTAANDIFSDLLINNRWKSLAIEFPNICMISPTAVDISAVTLELKRSYPELDTAHWPQFRYRDRQYLVKYQGLDYISELMINFHLYKHALNLYQVHLMGSNMEFRYDKPLGHGVSSRYQGRGIEAVQCTPSLTDQDINDHEFYDIVVRCGNQQGMIMASRPGR
jgi:hypothetical protein